MRAGVIAISALLVAIGLVNLGLGLQATLLGVRAGIEGFAIDSVGLIMSANYVGFVAGSLLGPWIVGRVGHIRAFAAMAAIGSVAVVLHPLFLATGPWTVLRAVTGFSYAGLCMVVESWLNQRAQNADRGTLLSLYMAATLGASAASQLLLNIWPPVGFEPFILVSIVLSLSLLPVALTTSPAPPLTHARPMGLGALFRASPAGVVGCFATGVLYAAMGGLGAVFAQAIGMSTFEISIFVMLIVVGGTVSLWPMGWLSDRLDRRGVIAGLFFAAAATALAIVLAVAMQADTAYAPLLYVLGALYGAAALPIYGIALAHANDKLASGQYVPASSSLLLCYGLGAMCGPLGASYVMKAVGPWGLFVFVGAIGAAAGAFVIWRTTRKAPVLPEEKHRFEPVPATTASALSLAETKEPPKEAAE
jgi:MFS family permease